jgi:hypothetical protein
VLAGEVLVSQPYRQTIAIGHRVDSGLQVHFWAIATYGGGA